MFGCRKARGIIAASIYDDVSAEERAYLARHVTACAACRAEAESLPRFAGAIPVPPAQFTGDLLPVVRQRLMETPARSAWTGWRVALPVAACIMLAAAFGYISRDDRRVSGPDVAAVAAASPIDAAIAAALEQSDQQFGKAVLALREAIQAYPDDPRAGEAQLLLANLEFSHGQRYAEALAAYDALRRHYPQTWNTSPGAVKDRYDLLAEARLQNFEPLYQFDAARNSGDAFAQLEKLVAKHPCKLVASLAIETMRERLCGPEDSMAMETRIDAMEFVRDRCTDPVAIAQINVTLGDMYWRDLRDFERAREAYTQAAGSGHITLASVARAALWEMDSMAAGILP